MAIIKTENTKTQPQLREVQNKIYLRGALGLQLDLSSNSLPVYEALASEVRLKILQKISQKEYSITELAAELGLSKAITTKHVQKLEQARLVQADRSKSGHKKVPRLMVDSIEVEFPCKIYSSYSSYQDDIQVGHYTGFEVSPTCGLAGLDAGIGKFDDPRSFVDPNHFNAAMLWFSAGYVEYMIPNRLEEKQTPKMLEISMELASEFPYSNNVWPSDIGFSINGVKVGTWTCPGNFSDTRGFYTPQWWHDDLSQYGLLKHLRISESETSIDGQVLSQVGLDDLKLREKDFIVLRIIASKEETHSGGVTIFGRGFGNYDQNIFVSLYYC